MGAIDSVYRIIERVHSSILVLHTAPIERRWLYPSFTFQLACQLVEQPAWQDVYARLFLSGYTDELVHLGEDPISLTIFAIALLRQHHNPVSPTV